MGIKFLSEKKIYKVSYSKRHPMTKEPRTLTRTQYRDALGILKPITTMANAKRVYRELIIEIEEILTRISIPKWSMLIEEFGPFYLSTGVQIKTVDVYISCLKKHTSAWSDYGIETIDGVMIRDLLNSLDKKSISHKKNMYKFIKRCFDYAVEKNYLVKSPMPSMKFNISHKNAAILNEADITNLLFMANTQKSKWYYHWALALHTGMRNGELYSLKWSCIDFRSGFIQVKESWNNKDGYKSTKSGDERLIPINKELNSLLRELKLNHNGSEFVLTHYNQWTKGEQARELRKFLVGINLPPIRFHDLRASWATLLLSKGTPPIKVMAMGGWKDMKTMMIYIRKAGVDLNGSTDCLNLTIKDDRKPRILFLSDNEKKP